MNKQQTDHPGNTLITHPLVGSVLTVLSALSFLFLCMILPLVGPAAMRGSGSPGADTAPHVGANITAFLSVLLLTFILGALGVYSKLQRRKIDGSPLPFWSVALCGICVFLLIAFLTGLLQI